MAPASGVEIRLVPGTNFVKSSVQAPRFMYPSSVLRTQVSGSSENLQSNRRTERPRQRPSSYQSRSPSSAAKTATSKVSQNEYRPSPTAAPMINRRGSDGIGTPAWTARTQQNKKA